VPVLVVDGLQSVDVDEPDQQRPLRPPSAGELVRQPRESGPAAKRTGEVVVAFQSELGARHLTIGRGPAAVRSGGLTVASRDIASDGRACARAGSDAPGRQRVGNRRVGTIPRRDIAALHLLHLAVEHGGELIATHGGRVPFLGGPVAQRSDVVSPRDASSLACVAMSRSIVLCARERRVSSQFAADVRLDSAWSASAASWSRSDAR
jgi:hypothetical protein